MKHVVHLPYTGCTDSFVDFVTTFPDGLINKSLMARPPPCQAVEIVACVSSLASVKGIMFLATAQLVDRICYQRPIHNARQSLDEELAEGQMVCRDPIRTFRVRGEIDQLRARRPPIRSPDRARRLSHHRNQVRCGRPISIPMILLPVGHEKDHAVDVRRRRAGDQLVVCFPKPISDRRRTSSGDRRDRDGLQVNGSQRV